MNTQAVVFIAVAGSLTLLALLALAQIGLLRLESKLGISRDGLRPGTRAPEWQLTDIRGSLRRTPNRESWQLLVFTDHSLREFPRLIAGIKHLSAQESALEVLLLPQADSDLKIELTVAVADAFELPVSIVPVDEAFYWHYNVRVLPFVFFLDPAGIVRMCGLVNEETHLFKMSRMSRLSPKSHKKSRRLPFALRGA